MSPDFANNALSFTCAAILALCIGILIELIFDRDNQ